MDTGLCAPRACGFYMGSEELGYCAKMHVVLMGKRDRRRYSRECGGWYE